MDSFVTFEGEKSLDIDVGSQPSRWIWLPVLIFALTVSILSTTRNDVAYEPRWLLPALNAIFLVTTSFLAATLSARTYLAGGPTALLPMGAGMLVLTMISFVGVLALSVGHLSAAITIHNCGMFLCATGQLLGALWLVFPHPPSKRPRAVSVIWAYAIGVLLVAILAANVSRIPPFITDGQDSTNLRRLVLGSSVLEFFGASLVMLISAYRSRAGFLHWYALGLLLFSIGLAGVALPVAIGSPLGWAGRAAQYAGGIYLLIAVAIAVRHGNGWTIPLRQLHETHHRYGTLVELCPDPILVHCEGRWAFANPAAAALLGSDSPADLIGRSVADFLSAGQNDLALEATDLQTLTLCRTDGSYVEVEAIAARVQYEGRPAVQVVLHDLSERKRAQQERERLLLEKQRQGDFLKKLIDHAPIGIAVIDKDFRYLLANSAHRQITGTPDTPMIGRQLQDIFRPEISEMVRSFVQNAIVEGKPVHIPEYPLAVTPEQERSWWTVDEIPLRDAASDIEAVLLLTQDITEHKRHEEALSVAEHRYHSLFDSMTEGFVIHELITDERGEPTDFRFLDVNPAFLRLCGMRREDLIGASCTKSLDCDGVKLLRIYSQVARTGKSIQFENYCRSLNKHLEIFAYRHAPGQFAAIFRDVTQRKKIERDLHRASAAKDQFIASLSHELRTPLTPVVASLSTLVRDPRLPEELRQDLLMVERNIGLEVHLINDLLDVTRIVNGKLELHREAVDVISVLSDVSQIVAADLNARRQKLILPAHPGPFWANADRARLHQVFWNLVKNAIKFSPPETMIVVDAAAEEGRIRVRVKDSGPGISPAQLPRLFRAFEQGLNSSFGGLGLGLAICKGVVDLHGGMIAATNDATGAIFIVELPMLSKAPSATTQAQVTPVKKPSDQPLRILLVEDHEDTARVLERLLRAQNHQVTCASSIALALTTAAANQFDVLISDLGLPDGTGHDLMNRLKSSGHKIPAIAVSGFGAHDDIRRSMDAGFCEHLIKPLTFDALHNAIIRTTQRKQSSASASAATAATAPVAPAPA